MIQIKINQRGGRFYLSSDDIQGLWLWGENLEQLKDDLIPTINYLRKTNEGIDLEISKHDLLFVHNVSKY